MTCLESELFKHFGHHSFRDGQRQIVEAVLDGRDVLAICPTNFGKSILFQLPGFIEKGVTIVVSPLISLMQDQVEKLNEQQGRCVAKYWNSSVDRTQKTQILQEVKEETLNFLYVSPEALTSPPVYKSLKNVNVNRVVVDEAHLLEHWGKTFRQSFRKIGKVVNYIGGKKSIPILALTATASFRTVNSISNSLGRRFIEVSQYPLNKNIRYTISDFVEKPVQFNLNDLVKTYRSGERANSTTPLEKETLISKLEQFQGKKTIIFFLSKRKLEYFYSTLQSHTGTQKLYRYHGSMTHSQRESVQLEFAKDPNGVLLCTNAFGVGVDIRDIELSIHVDLPMSLDAFLQESGRAGRNGEAATSLVLFKENESDKVAKSLLAMNYPCSHTINRVYEFLSRDFRLSQQGKTYEKAKLAQTVGCSLSVLTHCLNSLAQQSAIKMTSQDKSTATVANLFHFDSEVFCSERDSAYWHFETLLRWVKGEVSLQQLVEDVYRKNGTNFPLRKRVTINELKTAINRVALKNNIHPNGFIGQVKRKTILRNIEKDGLCIEAISTNMRSDLIPNLFYELSEITKRNGSH
ncbi:hypothetical protein TUMSATVNIG1_60610 (plasmid) [Vibrio nigripulchritudo]|uniref:RecQ family ATP-dependent DNA helicase n=1 Tax=Vibrio nigripulchritudo TaxID=28173 RepID=UPI00190E1EC0|nr:RecQ family ATP-dependent DNA helicase [Vibrio nigripulchritudo]BCL74077.1 hypothetical protein VNTUMSATTG_60140 [Vibrio nigripulchritudo]BDU35452.1 hypothetical protein TUMSATVNIG1_60610 [Vibrio nigripulchritudo]